jgi:cbb3-type cytochrome oxidase subunit 3
MGVRMKKRHDESIKAIVGVVLLVLFIVSLCIVYYFINNGGKEIIEIISKEQSRL